MTETPSASALLKCDMAGDYTRLIRERTLNLDLMLQGKKQGKDAAHLFLKVIEKGMKIKMDA
ncbi:hypothetical protein [Desulfopila aestuarii]|nr:hypothetical protein [Desulfopila aestuarii]